MDDAATHTASAHIDKGDGSHYEGELDSGIPHGTGVLTYADGAVYRGEFAAGVPHGPGTLTQPNGDVLSGKWREGKWHGCMTATTKEDVREVKYADGVAAPTGTVKYNDGRCYEGEMQDWNPHGTGAYTCVHGTVFRMEFARGKRHGFGEWTNPDGDVLSGTWREGQPHGCMTKTTKDSFTEVECADGVAAPTGTVKYNDGRRSIMPSTGALQSGTVASRYMRCATCHSTSSNRRTGTGVSDSSLPFSYSTATTMSPSTPLPSMPWPCFWSSCHGPAYTHRAEAAGDDAPTGRAVPCNGVGRWTPLPQRFPAANSPRYSQLQCTTPSACVSNPVP